jgi:hypothetical protein
MAYSLTFFEKWSLDSKFTLLERDLQAQILQEQDFMARVTGQESRQDRQDFRRFSIKSADSWDEKSKILKFFLLLCS